MRMYKIRTKNEFHNVDCSASLNPPTAKDVAEVERYMRNDYTPLYECSDYLRGVLVRASKRGCKSFKCHCSNRVTIEAVN